MVKEFLFKVRVNLIVKYGLMLAFISVGLFLVSMHDNSLSDNTKSINLFSIIFVLIVLALYFILKYYLQMKKIICAEDMEGCQ